MWTVFNVREPGKVSRPPPSLTLDSTTRGFSRRRCKTPAPLRPSAPPLVQGAIREVINGPAERSSGLTVSLQQPWPTVGWLDAICHQVDGEAGLPLLTFMSDLKGKPDINVREEPSLKHLPGSGTKSLQSYDSLADGFKAI